MHLLRNFRQLHNGRHWNSLLTIDKYEIVLLVMICRLHVLCNEMRTNTIMLSFLTLDLSISKMAAYFNLTLEPYGIKLKKNMISTFEDSDGDLN